MANPLDKYVTSKPGNFARDFKVPALPSLKKSMAGKSVVTMEAALAHDQSMEQFRRDLEQSISERIRQAEDSSTTATAAPTIAPEISVSAPSVNLSGIEADIALLQTQVANITTSLEPSNMLGNNNTIVAGSNMTIPSGFSLILAGPVTIDGILIVDGILMTLPL